MVIMIWYCASASDLDFGTFCQHWSNYNPTGVMNSPNSSSPAVGRRWQIQYRPYTEQERCWGTRHSRRERHTWNSDAAEADGDRQEHDRVYAVHHHSKTEEEKRRQTKTLTAATSLFVLSHAMNEGSTENWLTLKKNRDFSAWVGRQTVAIVKTCVSSSVCLSHGYYA